jgi:single-strand DNA-binding protein
MARSVNKVILIGNLGRDAETKFTPQGVAVSRFSIATTRRIKDNSTGDWKDETDWNNVVLWRNENLAQYLTKGKQVYVEGRLQTRSYEDKDGNKRYSTEVVAEEVMLLGRSGEGGEGGSMASGPRSAAQRVSNAPAGGAATPGGYDDFDPGISDDDVPF